MKVFLLANDESRADFRWLNYTLEYIDALEISCYQYNVCISRPYCFDGRPMPSSAVMVYSPYRQGPKFSSIAVLVYGWIGWIMNGWIMDWYHFAFTRLKACASAFEICSDSFLLLLTLEFKRVV